MNILFILVLLRSLARKSIKRRGLEATLEYLEEIDDLLDALRMELASDEKEGA